MISYQTCSLRIKAAKNVAESYFLRRKIHIKKTVIVLQCAYHLSDKVIVCDR